MPVRERPFHNLQQAIAVLGVNVTIFAYEPVVSVSITRPEVAVLPPDAPRFLAVVDTGNTLACNIREEHLKAWTGLAASDFPLHPGPPGRIHDASGTTVRLPRRLAKVWLHPYPEDRNLDPYDLQIAGGILVYESSQLAPSTPSPQLIGPHLPLLGARAFFPRGLKVVVDYERLLVSIRDEKLFP